MVNTYLAADIGDDPAYTAIGNYGVFTMVRGQIAADAYSFYNYHYPSFAYGRAVFEGGSLTSTSERTVCNCGELTINGGTFDGFISNPTADYPYDIDNSGQLIVNVDITVDELLLNNGGDAPDVPEKGTLSFGENGCLVGNSDSDCITIYSGATITEQNNMGLPIGATTEDYELFWNATSQEWQSSVINATQRLNYNSIQAAINAADPGDTIEVSPGTYTGNVVINKSLTLLSTDGAETTILDGVSTDPGLGTIHVNTGVNNLVIGSIDHGFHVKGIDGPADNEFAAVYFQGTQDNVTVQGNIIEARGDAGIMGMYNAANTNFTIDNNVITGQTFLGANPAGVGFDAQNTLLNVPRQLVVFGGGSGTTNTQNFTFTNNVLSGIAGGMSITNDSGAPIAPTPQGNTLMTLEIAGTCIVSNNTFSGITTRYAEALRMRASGAYTFSGNVFNGTYPVIATAATSTPAVGIARISDLLATSTFTKYAVVRSGGALAVAAISPTINGAIAAATAGQEVFVSAGTFTEDVLINKPLTLTGANADIPYGPGRGAESIIQPARNGYPAISLGTGVGPNNVTINGFEITGPMSENGVRCGETGPSYLTIKYNYFHHIGSDRDSQNIYAVNYRCAELDQTDINISYNYFDYVYNSLYPERLKSSAAIWMGQSPATGTISNVLIEYNTIKNVFRPAGSVFGADGPNVSGINIGCGWKSTGKLQSPVIRYNTISDLSGGVVYGIALQGNTPGAQIYGNTFNNLLPLNVPDYASAVCVFYNDGYGTNNGTGITAYNNSFTSTHYGIYNATTNQINGLSNWWGHASGPQHPVTNSSGQGAIVSDYVTYDPWFANTEMTVIGSNNPIENVTQNEFFETIQAAVNAATPEDVIVIEGGTYTENILINKKVTLQPANREPIILDGGGTGSVITITANGVEVTGMTIQNSGSGQTDAGILINQASGCNIHGNTITDNANGIALAMSDENSVINNVIHDNSYFGIALAGASDNTIQGNNIYDNGSADVNAHAIALDNANAVGGLISTGADGNFIKDNDVAGPNDGIFIGENCIYNEITDGNSITASRIGISLWHTGDTIITGNDIYDCLAGIRLLGSSNNTITYNDIYHNEAGIKLQVDSNGNILCADNLIENNKFMGYHPPYGDYDVGMYAIMNILHVDPNTEDEHISAVSAQQNYWGSSGDPATIVTNVDYDPWWIDEDMTILSNTVSLNLEKEEELIKDEETQTYTVVMPVVQDIRGYQIRVKAPKVDYEEPSAITMGTAFENYDLPLVWTADEDYWLVDVSAALLGESGTTSGPDLVLFTFDLTSKLDASNLDGSVVELELITLYDEMNHPIPYTGTTEQSVIIDSGEPVVVVNSPADEMLLAVETSGSGFLVRPELALSFTDDYNLAFGKYLIQAAALDEPLYADFTLDLPAIDGLTTDHNWQLPEAVDELADGDYTVYFLVEDDASNNEIYTWNFTIDKTATDAITWAIGSAACRTTIDANNSIDLAWTNPAGAVKNHIWYYSYADLSEDTNAYPEYNPAVFEVPSPPTSPIAYLEEDENGWVKAAEIDAAGTYTHTGMDRGYYYYIIFVEDASGNISIGSPVKESISYWPGDVSVNSAVDLDDVAALAAVWGTDGSGNTACDVGPTVNRLRRGRPLPDNIINIEDLMIFAMNYLNTDYDAYNRTLPELNPIRIELLTEAVDDRLLVHIVLSDNNSFVRALNIPVSYGNDLSLQSVELGNIWPEDSILLHTNSDNVVELSMSGLGMETVVEGNGVVATLSFLMNGDTVETELLPMIARDIENIEIEIVNNPTGGVDNDEEVIVIPATDFLGNAYPNPFNPTTTISYGITEAQNVRITVYNSRGQSVRTLVNANMPAGTYNIVWDGRDDSNRSVSSGLYFFRMESGNHLQIKKAILMK